MTGRNHFPKATKTSGNKRPPILVTNKTGTANMQFIFDMIWNQSRSNFLASMGQREAQ